MRVDVTGRAVRAELEKEICWVCYGLLVLSWEHWEVEESLSGVSQSYLFSKMPFWLLWLRFGASLAEAPIWTPAPMSGGSQLACNSSSRRIQHPLLACVGTFTHVQCTDTHTHN